MTTQRKIAVWLGWLLIATIVLGILNTVPALEHPGYLAKLPTIETQVLSAVFFQAAMATTYVFIAVLFYLLIKKHSEVLAIGYLGFRLIGAAFLFVGIGSLLLLLSLGKSYTTGGQPLPSFYQTLGELLRSGRDIMNHIAVILPWVSGGLILCVGLYRFKLVPAWLSIWGFVGFALSIAATLLLMLDLIKMFAPPYLLMNVPAALFDLALAVRLMVRGLDPGAEAPGDRASSSRRSGYTPIPPSALETGGD